MLELLEGETLREKLAAGAISQRKAVDYAVQIANGLAAAHEKGIVHRDLAVFLFAAAIAAMVIVRPESHEMHVGGDT